VQKVMTIFSVFISWWNSKDV